MHKDEVNRLMAQLANWDEAQNRQKERVGERATRFEEPSEDFLEAMWFYDRVQFTGRRIWPSSEDDDYARSEERARRVRREHRYEPRYSWFEYDGTSIPRYRRKTKDGYIYPFHTQHVWLCDHARHFLYERSSKCPEEAVEEYERSFSASYDKPREIVEYTCWEILYYYCYPRNMTRWRRCILECLQRAELTVGRVYGPETARDLSLLLLCLLEEITRLRADDYDYYGYAANGYYAFSWDPDGLIQERAGFDKLAILRFVCLTRRNSFIWDLWPFKSRILDLYDRVCEGFAEMTSADNEALWPYPHQRQFIADVLRGEYDREELNNDFVKDLLKISEQVMREQIPNLRYFSVEDEMAELQWALPEPVFSRFLEVLDSWELPDFSVREVGYILTRHRSGARFTRDWLLEDRRSLMEQLSLLDRLTEPEALALLKGFKWEAMPESLVGIRAILELQAGSKLTKVMRQRLGSPDPSQEAFLELLIKGSKQQEANDLTLLAQHLETQGIVNGRIYGPQFMAQYSELIRNDRWASFLYLVLALLKQPRQRTLELDPRKIQVSRKRLSQTVDLVDDYVGDDSCSEIKTEPPDDGNNKSRSAGDTRDTAERTLLQRLLEEENMPEEDLAVLAEGYGLRAATLIHEVNDRFFDEIGAQLLFLEDGCWTIDALDRDIVKAHLNLGETADDGSMI